MLMEFQLHLATQEITFGQQSLHFSAACRIGALWSRTVRGIV